MPERRRKHSTSKKSSRKPGKRGKSSKRKALVDLVRTQVKNEVNKSSTSRFVFPTEIAWTAVPDTGVSAKLSPDLSVGNAYNNYEFKDEDVHMNVHLMISFRGALTYNEHYNIIRWIIVQAKSDGVGNPVIGDFNVLRALASVNAENMAMWPIGTQEEMSVINDTASRDDWIVKRSGIIKVAPSVQELATYVGTTDTYPYWRTGYGDGRVPNIKTINLYLKYVHKQDANLVTNPLHIILWSDSTAASHPSYQINSKFSWRS